MNDLYLTDEDIHGCEEDSEVIKLHEDLEKAEEMIDDLKDIINTAITKLKLANKINERCFAEETNKVIKKFLELEIKHNTELLELLSYEE